MRRVHFAVEHRLGRFVTRRWLKTRISPEGWKLIPVPPAEAAAQISPVPLLIVHGEKDHYFPPEHARQLYMAAREPKDLWLIPDMGHAEAASWKVLKSTNKLFEEPARETIMKSVFKPARIKGAAVRQLVQQGMVFNVGQ